MEKGRLKKWKDRIKSNHKERDFSIVMEKALNPQYTLQDLIDVLNLDITYQRVDQILKENKTLKYEILLTENPLATEAGRVEELIAEYHNTKKRRKITRKDYLDILEQVKSELKEDKAVVDQSKHQHFTVVWKKENGKEKRINPPRQSVESLGE